MCVCVCAKTDAEITNWYPYLYFMTAVFKPDISQKYDTCVDILKCQIKGLFKAH